MVRAVGRGILPAHCGRLRLCVHAGDAVVTLCVRALSALRSDLARTEQSAANQADRRGRGAHRGGVGAGHCVHLGMQSPRPGQTVAAGPRATDVHVHSVTSRVTVSTSRRRVLTRVRCRPCAVGSRQQRGPRDADGGGVLLSESGVGGRRSVPHCVPPQLRQVRRRSCTSLHTSLHSLALVFISIAVRAVRGDEQRVRVRLWPASRHRRVHGHWRSACAAGAVPYRVCMPAELRGYFRICS